MPALSSWPLAVVFDKHHRFARYDNPELWRNQSEMASFLHVTAEPPVRLRERPFSFIIHTKSGLAKEVRS
jgi:hypothetical protein